MCIGKIFQDISSQSGEKAMNDSLIKSAEAQKLEEDYMVRLKNALRQVPESESRQIMDDVREHIRAALTESHAGSEIGLTRMAAVLEELGPPEEMAQDPVEEDTRPKTTVPPMPSAPPQDTDRGLPGDDDKIGERLDQLFAAFAVIILGLHIPFIDLYFCSIIGSVMLVYFLGRMVDEPELKEIESARPFALGLLLSYVLLFPLGLLSLVGGGVKIFADILTLPVGIAQVVCDLTSYWIIMGVLAGVAQRRGAGQLAEQVKRRRIVYLLLYFALIMLAVVVGVVLGLAKVNGAVIELVTYCVLPLGWILGWVFVLSPIREVRRIMRKP
jgi:hypothetical protein